jgi:hypothetical protein
MSRPALFPIAIPVLVVTSPDAHERTFTILNDNSLLRLASLRERHHRYCLCYDHIAGAANAMADDTSRLWWHLSDSTQLLLAHFEQNYPQSQPWQL